MVDMVARPKLFFAYTLFLKYSNKKHGDRVWLLM